MQPTAGSGLDKFDVAVFAASCDEPEVNKAFAESLKVDYPILSDPDHKAAKAFGILSERGFSQRVTIYIGKNGKVLFVDRSPKVGSHGADVAEKLAELGVARRE